MSRRYIQHLRSKDVETIQQYGLNKDIPKVPETDNLKEGEIAINYAKDNEIISIKNDNDEIVKFLNEKVIYENEEITAAAMSQLKNEIANEINNINETIENFEPGDAGVQSDWNETNEESLAYIKNKPTIPTKVSDLTNDSEFVTAEVMQIQVTRNSGTTYVCDKRPAEMKEALRDNRILKLYYNNKEYLLTSVNGINGTSGNIVFERVNDDNTYSKFTIAWTDIEDSTTTTVSYETNAYIGFDNTPTANSTKAVTSGGAKTYVDNKIPLYVTLTSEMVSGSGYTNITSDTDFSTIANAYTSHRVVVLRNCVIDDGQSSARPDDTGYVYYLKRKLGTSKLQFIAIEDIPGTDEHLLWLFIFEVSPGDTQDVWTFRSESMPYIYNANWIKNETYDYDNPTRRTIERYNALLEAINNGRMIMLQNHLATVIDTTSEVDTIFLKFGSSDWKASGGVTTAAIVKYEDANYCEVTIGEVNPVYDASWILSTDEHTVENFDALLQATDTSIAIYMHTTNFRTLYAIQISTFNANVSLTFLDGNTPSIIIYNIHVENGSVVVNRSDRLLALTS